MTDNILNSDLPKPLRRRRVRPAPGQGLIVGAPAIDEVLDVQAGEFVSSAEVMGTDYAALVQLRTRVRTQMRKNDPLYKCATCGVAVHICCSPKETRFFFKHRHEDGNCPAITAGKLSQEEIDARKYNGLKESALHVQMKDWLVRCMRTDGAFSDIKTEAVWKGAWSSAWRKPDVQAVYQGQKIAFEVQLSTTFLDLIAARRDFYLGEGGLLFWIFARFDTDRLRMTEDDVFYNNNWNAFVVNRDTVEASLREGAFRLECVWSVPVGDGGASGLHRKMVGFSDLTLDPATQRGFYFDFEGTRRQLKDRAEEAARQLRADFERMFCAGAYYGDEGKPIWAALRSRFSRADIEFVKRPGDLPFALLQALYSAKLGHPVVSKRKRLVEIAHSVATGEKHNLRWFSSALRHYGRAAQLKADDRSGLWAKKVIACRQEEAESPEVFQSDRTHQRLVEFLFPELHPFP